VGGLRRSRQKLEGKHDEVPTKVGRSNHWEKGRTWYKTAGTEEAARGGFDNGEKLVGRALNMGGGPWGPGD